MHEYQILQYTEYIHKNILGKGGYPFSLYQQHANSLWENAHLAQGPLGLP